MTAPTVAQDDHDPRDARSDPPAREVRSMMSVPTSRSPSSFVTPDRLRRAADGRRSCRRTADLAVRMQLGVAFAMRFGPPKITVSTPAPSLVVEHDLGPRRVDLADLAARRLGRARQSRVDRVEGIGAPRSGDGDAVGMRAPQAATIQTAAERARTHRRGECRRMAADDRRPASTPTGGRSWRRARTATLVTIGPDGTARPVPICFVLDAGRPGPLHADRREAEARPTTR